MVAWRQGHWLGCCCCKMKKSILPCKKFKIMYCKVHFWIQPSYKNSWRIGCKINKILPHKKHCVILTIVFVGHYGLNGKELSYIYYFGTWVCFTLWCIDQDIFDDDETWYVWERKKPQSLHLEILRIARLKDHEDQKFKSLFFLGLR